MPKARSSKIASIVYEKKSPGNIGNLYMKKGNRIFKVGKVQVGLLSLLLIFCLTIPSYSEVEQTVFKLDIQELIGVAGPNNVAIVSERYAFVAPFEPSKALSTETPEEWDNNRLFLFDAKKINNVPVEYPLGNCYFPTLVLFSYDTEDTGTVFVKGTEFFKTVSGEYKNYAVFKYLHFNLSGDGKPVSGGSSVTIRIPDIEEKGEGVATAPDFIRNFGDVSIFTNGGSILTFSRKHGYLYRVNFISKNDYDSVNNTITYLGFDSITKVVTVLINKKVEVDHQWKNSSELYFYQLDDDGGTLNLLKKLDQEAFPPGVFVPAGSNPVIDGDAKNAGFAYFVGNNGVLYQTNLTEKGSLSGSVEDLAVFEELGQPNGEYLSAIHTSYNHENRVFEVLKSGYTSYIHRPINVGSGRIGKIHRPINVRFNVEGPALVLAQFSKRDKLINQKVFTTEMAVQGGFIEPFSDRSGNRYMASFKGNIFELNMAQGVEKARLNLLGQIGSRLSSAVYVPGRDLIVTIKSCELNDDGISIPGAIGTAKRREESNFLSFVNWTADSFSFNPVLGTGIGSIRRPCNFRLQ